MAENWRRLAVVVIFGVGLLVETLLFTRILTARQRTDEARAEQQRAAICAILQNIPGRVPTEIVHARQVFARPHHPADCQPIHRAPTVARPTPVPTRTVVLIPPTSSTRPAPSPSRTSSPHSSPRPSPSHRPTPTPSRTCTVKVGPVCV